MDAGSERVAVDPRRHRSHQRSLLRLHHHLCDVTALGRGHVRAATALSAGGVRPAARPLWPARGRSTRVARRRPRMVPTACRATGCVHGVFLLHAQLHVERLCSSASQLLVCPSPASCSDFQASHPDYQHDSVALRRDSASPDGARLHPSTRGRLCGQLQRRLRMSADARRRASRHRGATNQSLPPAARLLRRRLPRRLRPHNRRDDGAHGKISSGLPARGDVTRLPRQPAAGVLPGAGFADAGVFPLICPLLGTNDIFSGLACDEVIVGHRGRVHCGLVRHAGHHIGVAGHPPFCCAGVWAWPSGTNFGVARRSHADAAAASAEESDEELHKLRISGLLTRPPPSRRHLQLLLLRWAGKSNSGVESRKRKEGGEFPPSPVRKRK